MPFIDNREQTMFDALSNAIDSADEIDICVGYFYFSGFQLLADKLKDKKKGPACYVRGLFCCLLIGSNGLHRIHSCSKRGGHDTGYNSNRRGYTKAQDDVIEG